ncbi:MAG: hypothetical protein HYY18_20420 [Planctomycetes bacterium]|nr:hypothetical protein [Planctomycetota bacterium]
MNIPRAAPRAVALLLVILAPIRCFAYGGWKSSDDAGLFRELAPALTEAFLLFFIPYLLLSSWLDRARRLHGLRILPFLVASVLLVGGLLPNLFALGEYGPAHVAVHFAGQAALLFYAALTAKWILLEWQDRLTGAGSEPGSATPRARC